MNWDKRKDCEEEKSNKKRKKELGLGVFFFTRVGLH